MRMDWIHWILESDTQLLLAVQETGGNTLADRLMLALREAKTWIPLYAFMVWWAWRHARPQALIFVFLSVAAVGMADFVSASVLKPLAGRLRPCQEPELEGVMRVLKGCGGQYGLPSSHASNHFTLATFWYWAIRQLKGQRWTWLFGWAFLIGYAQVYVGKHYPLDIVGGAILGVYLGALAAWVLEGWLQRRRVPGSGVFEVH